MQTISEKKKRFLESIGIDDIDSLPSEFEKYNKNMEEVLSREELTFLNSEALTGVYNKTFALKDLVGTIHYDYYNHTWLETFLLSKRGDDAIDQYNANPDYYSKDLKQRDQSTLHHDTPIELYECEGKFFIKGGNNRLSLIMMKYLAEISKTQTEEEKAEIDKKYTFVAEVQSVPKDKDIMYMLNMLKENYKNKGIKNEIIRTSVNDTDYQYIIKLEEQTITVNSKEDLEKVLRDSYQFQLENVQNPEELRNNILDFIVDTYVNSEDRKRILNYIFPNIQQFQEEFNKLKKDEIEKLYDEIDLKNIDFIELSKKITQITEKREIKIAQEQLDEEPKATVEQSKNIETNEEKREQFKKALVINSKKRCIEEQVTSIPDNLKATYYELEQQEIKFSSLAKKMNLDYSTTKVEETNIPLGIEQIKNNMQKVNIQIQNANDLTKLNKASEVFQKLENLTKNEIKFGYISELKETFEKSFDNKVQDLIKNAKISKLEEEKNKIKEEKISIIGRLLGKGKLKQAKIDNIDLQIQLLMSDSGNDKINLSLEDSLSDLYAYLQYDLEKKPTPAISEFLHTIKSTPQLLEMIDKSKLGQQFNEKMNAKQYDKQLTISDNKINNRRQANMLQIQNNELSQQIQSNKFNAISKQNNLSHIVINSNSSLNKFQGIVNKINLSIKSKEEKQLSRNEQENEMQL